MVVVGTLALALGANTAIFSVTHAVLLRALPYDSAERVVRAEPAPIGGQGAIGWGIHPDFLGEPIIESAAIFLADGGANLVEGSSASRVRVAQVEPAFFSVMGVDLALGPGMTDQTEAGREAVLGHGLWMRAFGGDPDVLGRSITLSGHGYQVVGVAPPEVTYPAGTELWLSPPLEGSFFGGAVAARAVARLVPGARPEELRPILEERRRQQYARAPASLVPPPIEVLPVLDELTGPVRAPLVVLMATAAVLLLLGCLNLASLALSRVSDRLEDLRVRNALGASRSRIFGELLAEVLILSLIGGAVGVAVATTGVRVLVGWLPAEVPGMNAVELSGPVLLFGLAATVASALVAGMLPALRGAAVGGAPRLARGITEDVTGGRMQARLLAGQVALAVVLCVGAGLLGRSLRQLMSVPLGYDTDDVLAFQVQLGGEESDEPSWGPYTSEVIRRVEALPGVSAVGATSRLPFTPGFGRGTDVRSSPDSDPTGATLVDASPGYFRAMGIPVLEGTPFRASDPEFGEGDVVLSVSLARTLFGDQPAVGQTVWVPRSRDEWQERHVRAVVGDVKLRGRLMTGWETVMYGDLRRTPVWFPGFAVRTTADPSAVRERIREALADVDPTVPPFRFQTIEEITSGEIASRRAAASLASLFGGEVLNELCDVLGVGDGWCRM
jgi:predicted permease